ncbi:hypothetical protein TeGR_g10903 [Tetraparma gracilis]|uniref:Protein kinase domain-containing protein n=1 Tax=Tetraparma gracilis TaxID=2962635 RepID=A0ABQ6MCQ1_9STRA|nr:hypothetical protein TeGR_g10903 [Tetraparma gracilis]
MLPSLTSSASSDPPSSPPKPSVVSRLRSNVASSRSPPNPDDDDGVVEVDSDAEDESTPREASPPPARAAPPQEAGAPRDLRSRSAPALPGPALAPPPVSAPAPPAGSAAAGAGRRALRKSLTLSADQLSGTPSASTSATPATTPGSTAASEAEQGCLPGVAPGGGLPGGGLPGEGLGSPSGLGLAALPPSLFPPSLFTPSLSSLLVTTGVKIGSGATASVYRAVDASSLRVYALKKILIDSPDKARMLAAELTALASAPGEHRNIVNYSGSYYLARSKTAVMAMEYMSLGPLSSLISLLHENPAVPRPLYMSVVTSVSRDVLSGLSSFHAMQRLHRDIKPANVLLSRGGVAKLSDFGLARSVEEDPLTEATSYVGTQNFMSPERLYGGSYTCTSDVWSAGMTIYTALLGGYPLSQSLKFWDLVASLEKLPTTTMFEEEETQDFFKKCFSPADVRPGAEELLAHPVLSRERFPPPSGADWDLLRSLVRSQNSSSNLTSDDLASLSLSILRHRASLSSRAVTDDEKKALAHDLHVFPAAVEEAFQHAKRELLKDQSLYETAAKPVQARRRRRTFVAKTPKAGGEEESEGESSGLGEVPRVRFDEGSPFGRDEESPFRRGEASPFRDSGGLPAATSDTPTNAMVAAMAEATIASPDRIMEEGGGAVGGGSGVGGATASARRKRRSRRRTYDTGGTGAGMDNVPSPKNFVLPDIGEAAPPSGPPGYRRSRTFDPDEKEKIRHQMEEEEQGGEGRTMRTKSDYVGQQDKTEWL